MAPVKYGGAVKAPVYNRGIAPDWFLDAIITWAKNAPAEIFAPNPVPLDIYALIKPQLGPWTGPDHRRAALLEAMRVHAGFESGWNPKEGVDVTNHTSMAHISGQETGIFQVSYDSIYLGGPSHPMQIFLSHQGMSTDGTAGAIHAFIDRMKHDLPFALEYYARLVRLNIKWAGPLARKEINPWLRAAAVAEFQRFLA
jgi:hypothetical protein